MKTNSNDFKSQTLKNTRKLGLWTAAWVITMALASFGPKFLWDNNPVLSSAAIILNLILGVFMIMANRTYINGLDELQRKIHLDAMAISLGAGVVGGLSYSLLDTTNVIPWDAEISFVVILMSLVYLVTVAINQKRYL
ncbi:hypothetical protein [Robertkochia sediminum]|uniref:hypothetical protein n=1 Tax=Robertkochia sediminum TaxID=2785326 RepID=UPI001932AA87|nr:hypothetical protein [Robertkochia sediminum]MBL7471273.1 hypothetical protein [Robertkochia sediminum]